MSNAILVRFSDGCEQAYELDEDIDEVTIGDIVGERFIPNASE